MESSDNEATEVDILHPEILSKDDLISLLSEHHIKLDRPQTSKDDLIEIFHRTITPLPQRKPRANRRGRAIAHIHKKLQAKRRLEGKSSDASKAMLKIGFSKRNQQTQGPTSSSHSTSVPGTSRLKPPPIVSSKRVIKLNNTSSSSSSSTSMSTQSSSSSSEASPDKKETSSSTAKLSKITFERKKIVFSDTSAAKSLKSDQDSGIGTSPTAGIRRDFTAIKLGGSANASVSPVANQMQTISLKSPGSGAGANTAKKGLKRPAPSDVNGKTNSGSTDAKRKSASSDDNAASRKKIKKISWP